MAKTRTLKASKKRTVNRTATSTPPGTDDSAAPPSRRTAPLLLEIAWEACNKVGGIYTVLRSKVPNMVDHWSHHYCLVGPYSEKTASVEFEPAPLTGPVGQAVKQLQEQGVNAHYGRWLVTGRPHIVLLDYLSVFPSLHEVKYRLWNDHGISSPGDDELVNNVIAFGEATRRLLQILGQREGGRRQLLAHIHEWMGGACIPMLRREGWPGGIVFTTHATILGRYLAMGAGDFYGHLPFYNPWEEANKFNIPAQYGLERAAAHGAHVFTTVSDVTADECRHLLGRPPEMLLPNGLNIQRFQALHEFQNLHQKYKEKIHQFTIGHFFPSYHFDLDRTIYMFTSGRYEYRNKGMDLTVEALARLNARLQHSNEAGVTVVAFIITKRPIKSMNVTALHYRAMLDEFANIADAVKEEVGHRLFLSAAEGRTPDLNQLMDEYWRLRLRRAIHSWRRGMPPGILTHDLVDDAHDELLNQLRACQLWNQQHNPVKVVYHPDFIDPSNPLFGLEYDQFVRGCHLGVFPSYYEPWGYTPLESIALGVPAVTSDLSGFGTYIAGMQQEHEEKGLYMIHRRDTSYEASASQLADRLYEFSQLNRRQRVDMRNSVEAFSTHFDWNNLVTHYHEAHEMALSQVPVKG